MGRESIFVKVYDIEVWNVMRKKKLWKRRREEEKLERERERSK